MAKRNLLLEYSEELAVKIVKICAEYKIDSNTVFHLILDLIYDTLYTTFVQKKGDNYRYEIYSRS